MTEGRSSRVCFNFCGRLAVLFLGAAAMVSSVFAVYSCEFFSYRTLDGTTWSGFEKPFDILSKASVGFFSYSGSTTSDGFLLFGDQCIDYDDWTEAGQSIFFQVAQWCSIFAPVAGFLAWFQILCESILCRLRGSYCFTVFFFLSATILQACTFLVFVDTEFCFQAASQNQCVLKTGAFYSAGSAAAYLILTMISTASKPAAGKRSTCGGCCVVTRGQGSLVFDEEDQKGHNSDTGSEDGLWHTDDEQEDDGSAVNWGVAEDNGSNGSKRSNKSRQSNSGESGLLLTTTGTDAEEMNMISNVTINDSSPKLLDSFTEIDQNPSKQNARKAPSQDSRERRPDYFDTMCCGDPLEVEKYLKTKSKKKRGKTEPMSYQETGDGGQITGIPVV